MFVLAVDDKGGERNFLATSVEMIDGVCLAVINGLITMIPLSSLKEVVPIQEATALTGMEEPFGTAQQQQLA